MQDSPITKAMDKLIQLALNPPSHDAAIMLIEETQVVHIAAISGLLQRANNQEAVDACYKVIDMHIEGLTQTLHEVVYVIAKGQSLTAKDIADVNLKTKLDIEIMIHNEEKN